MKSIRELTIQVNTSSAQDMDYGLKAGLVAELNGIRWDAEKAIIKVQQSKNLQDYASIMEKQILTLSIQIVSVVNHLAKQKINKPEWQITQQDREDRKQCFIHSGYLKVDKRSGFSQWTCCGEDKDAGPCSKAEHRAVEFPDEEAKKYFYDRPLKPVGVSVGKNVANEFEIYGRF